MAEPFTHEIRVSWGHCDPAKIAYTARLPEFALEAIDAWWEEVIGAGWYVSELDRNLGGPFVHMSLDFMSPVTPRHRLKCEVKPVRLGTKSLELQVIGRQDGVDCFKGRFVEVFVTGEGKMKTTTPTDEIRARIETAIAATA